MKSGCKDQSYSCSRSITAYSALLSPLRTGPSTAATAHNTKSHFITWDNIIVQECVGVLLAVLVMLCHVPVFAECFCALLCCAELSCFILMPKVIDKYVLQQQIGKGQFGEVFRGRHQQTLQQVAVKSICRERIKGKFYELLENEIKVLKTCDNPFIIKLHTLKKTPHNYYLMLEYCNGGDMLAKVRREGLLPQDEVIKYFCQILNAFQTLVKHKIMHRDFKLANILLHNGNIKIADFGFAKLLSHEDYATTILGSPLNMAPEVLGGNQYNNKADIWSIGACIYEMLFGKPPYVASNMVDLVKLIRAKPLVLPSEVPVCEELRDVLRRMLTADIKRRIDWRDLFNHPVTSYLSHKRKSEVELELAEDESLIINTSKCYLRNNLVLSSLGDIKAKAEVNDYLVDIIRHGKKTHEHPASQSLTESKDSSRSFRSNSKRILHYRNIYAFLASMADLISHCSHQHHEIAAYVVMRKIIAMIEWILKLTTQDECPLEGVTDWKHYRLSADFHEIEDYITRELEVFSVYNARLEPVIKKKSLNGDYDLDVKELIAGPLKEATYSKYLRKFLLALAGKMAAEAIASKGLEEKEDWKLLFYGLKIVRLEETFGRGEREFDFGEFYGLFSTLQEEKMLLEVESLISMNK